jgi:DNA adenine methylase
MNINLDLFAPHIVNNLAFAAGIDYTSYPKSPLRYPGGKARAVNILLHLIPSSINILVSPFFGGGSLEIAAAHFGVRILGFDIFDPLVDFWNELLTNPEQLATEVQKYYPLDRETFYTLQKGYPISRLDRAAQFFVLNRSSFSGATLSGGMSPGHPRFNQTSIDYLRSFYEPNISVQKQDYKLTLLYDSTNFLYLDPPYLIQSSLYGRNGNAHKGFDHHGLWKLLNGRSNWILSYNNCEEIREMYKGFRMLFPKWKYGMSSDKFSKEVLILSNDIPDIIGVDYA